MPNLRALSPFWPLALFFAFSSLAFGCMEGWAIATCEIILFLGAALVGWKDQDFWRWPRALWLPATIIVCLLAIGTLQLIPLPSSLWRTIGPDRVERYEKGAEAEALLHSPAYTNDPFTESQNPVEGQWPRLTPALPSWLPASFTPRETLLALVALAAGFCLVLLLNRLVASQERLHSLEYLVGLLGLTVALLALIQHKAYEGTILWARSSAHASSAFGPFVNPNHGAAFVNLTLPLLYHLIWRRFKQTRLLSEKTGALILIGGLLALHVAVIAVNSSRGAYLALYLYPAAWLAYASARKSRWLWIGAALYSAALASAAALAWQTGLLSDQGRSDLNANIPMKSWLLGNGLNSFNSRFPAIWVDLPALDPVRNTHLENEYLQLFFEAGAAPPLLAALWVVSVLLLSWKVCATGSSAFWLAPALIGETARAWVDFSAHAFPLVAAYLLLVAVALAAVGHSFRPGGCGALGRAAATGADAGGVP